ncbi:MAG: MFS transporter [Leptonema sp. (in: Bacteria)]|nr:MFS transporter [Leptonema sp. (in: bacteria)]
MATALAGMALLLPKLWDVIIDPVIGAISDKTKSRWGRRRIYLLIGAVPLGLFFFLTFITPQYPTELQTAAHIAVVFAIGCTFFSVVNIPYSSMAAEMSQDYNERISIISFRMIGASVGVLLAGGITMLIVEAGGGGAAGYRFMGLVLGSLIVVITLFSFWGTKDAVSLPAGEKMMPIKEQIRIAFKNTEFFALIDGTVIATTNADGIFDFSTALVSSISDTSNIAWTGMSNDWVVDSFNCNKWMDGSIIASGRNGQSNSTSNIAISYTVMNCNSTLVHLYCVEQ